MKAKRFLIFVPVLILALLLSGCIQTVVTLDIRQDLSADVDVKMGIDEDYYDMAGGDEAFSEMNTGEAEGFTVSSYNENGYKGIESKGTVANITEDNTVLNSMFGRNFIEADPEKNSMTFRAPISGVQSQIAGQSGYSLSQLESYGNIDMRITITFPYEIKDTNATGVSGRTLTWDLIKFDGTEMYAYTEGAPGFAVPMWLIIVIIIAAAAVVVIVLLRYFKKKKDAYGNADYAGYQQPDGNIYKDRYNGPSYNDPGFGQQMYAGQPETPDPQMTAGQPGTPDPQMTAEQPAAEEGFAMAFCPQCGAKLPGSGNFCPKCGHRLK